VPNHSEFELSADIIEKADALSREIVSIHNNLHVVDNRSTKGSSVFVTQGTKWNRRNEDAARIPLTMFELRKEPRSSCLHCTACEDQLLPCPVNPLVQLTASA
jgi:hypothetical protein